MNSWGKGLGVVLLLALIIVSCEDDNNLLGFASPDENFKVVYHEFSLPTSTYQVDSVVTSNGTSPPSRILAGAYQNSTFGNATATAYFQYFPVAYPVISDSATFERITLTLLFDYYHFGSEGSGSFTFEVRELADSLVTSSAHYTNSSTPILSKVIGTGSKIISPSSFDQAATDNADANAANDVADSLYFSPLSSSLGQAIFEAMRKTDSVSVATYRNFFRWRRIFKGLAVSSSSANMVIGFNPGSVTISGVNRPVRSNITIHYKEGTGANAARKLELTVAPASGMMAYTGLTIDRSGTELAALNGYYNELDLPSGERFIQCGGGLVTKVDLSPVYDYFDDIPLKSLNVAELSIVTEKQSTAPLSFFMRAVRPDNRFMLGLKKGLNEVYDSVIFADPAFIQKHYVNPNSAPRADIVGDDGAMFYLSQRSNDPTNVYKGYMTNFLQRELELVDKDYLREFGLIPSSPDFSKSLNGIKFHKDSVKLKVYYTTPNIKE